MNMFFHKMRTGKKGQIAAILTLALVIFIIAAFIVVNFGKNKIQDTRIKNAAQAGVLAGGSAACVLLNSMANFNDAMIMNFAGFTLQVQLMLISWVIDYVKTIIQAAKTLVLTAVGSGAKTILAVLTLCLTSTSLVLMVTGASKIGNALYRMIDELNTKLPKNSRDSARQYAFSNAGVDVSKIPFSQSGAADAEGYSLIETKFDEFMRLLPAINKGDSNYGTSVIEFDWNDSRTGHIVNNKVAVTVTPVLKVPFRIMRFKDISGASGMINAYLGTKDLGTVGGFLIKLAVKGAGATLALLWAATVLLYALCVYLSVIAVVEFILGIWTGVYLARAICVAVADAIATAALFAWLYAYSKASPGGIPCFVWDQNNPSNSYPLSVAVARTTSPASINYGIYTTDWPAQNRSASGIIKDGAIFPPNPKFDIMPNF